MNRNTTGPKAVSFAKSRAPRNGGEDLCNYHLSPHGPAQAKIRARLAAGCCPGCGNAKPECRCRSKRICPTEVQSRRITVDLLKRSEVSLGLTSVLATYAEYSARWETKTFGVRRDVLDRSSMIRCAARDGKTFGELNAELRRYGFKACKLRDFKTAREQCQAPK